MLKLQPALLLPPGARLWINGHLQELTPKAVLTDKVLATEALARVHNQTVACKVLARYVITGGITDHNKVRKVPVVRGLVRRGIADR